MSKPIQTERPESPQLEEVDSEYSIDLSVLERRAGQPISDEPASRYGTIKSEAARGNAVRAPDIIHTDEIGGPSDFTMNMEYWMRGGAQPKEPGPRRVAPQTHEPAPEGAADADNDSSDDDFEAQERILQELSSLDEDDSSVLSGTPRPSMLSDIRSRQAVVEESYDTPLKTRLSGGEPVVLPTNLDTLPPLPESSESGDTHIPQHEGRVKELEMLLASARAEIDNVREESRSETVRIQNSFKNTLKVQKDDSNEEVGSLRRTLRTLRAELRHTQIELEEKKTPEIQNESQEEDDLLMETKLEFQKLRLSHENLQGLLVDRDQLMKNLRDELEDTKARLANLDAEKRKEFLYLQSKLSASQNELEDLRLQHRVDQQEHSTLHQENRMFSNTVESMKEDLERAEQDNDDTKRLLDDRETALATLRDQHRDQIEAMRTRAQEAVRKACELRDREKRENESAQAALQVRDVELAQTREAISASELAFQSTKEQLRVLSAKLANSEATARDQQEELEIALASAEQAKEEQDAVNREVERRIAAVVKARDQSWEKRVNRLVEERKNMGKMLMQEWGRSECGLSKPQMYQYKYVGRSAAL